jgi:hypothetical protein
MCVCVFVLVCVCVCVFVFVFVCVCRLWWLCVFVCVCFSFLFVSLSVLYIFQQPFVYSIRPGKLALASLALYKLRRLIDTSSWSATSIQHSRVLFPPFSSSDFLLLIIQALKTNDLSNETAKTLPPAAALAHTPVHFLNGMEAIIQFPISWYVSSKTHHKMAYPMAALMRIDISKQYMWGSILVLAGRAQSKRFPSGRSD